MGPNFRLTGDPELDKDLAEDHQRDILEEVENDALADSETDTGEEYQPITDSKDDIVDTPKKEWRKHEDHQLGDRANKGLAD